MLDLGFIEEQTEPFRCFKIKENGKIFIDLMKKNGVNNHNGVGNHDGVYNQNGVGNHDGVDNQNGVGNHDGVDNHTKKRGHRLGNGK